MTIASEITRLQWAKASAKASIENKWVTVPASASVEDYHTYIDLIQTWWYFNGVKLKDYSRYDRDSTPSIAWYYSWEENDIQYSLILWTQEASSDNYWYRYGWVWTKHVSWSDIQYIASYSSDTYSGNRFNTSSWNYFLKNSTAWIIRGYTRVSTTYSTNWVYIFETVYDYINGTCTYWVYKTTENYSNWQEEITIPDWYVVVSGNAWIKSVTPFKDDSKWWFYITLK